MGKGIVSTGGMQTGIFLPVVLTALTFMTQMCTSTCTGSVSIVTGLDDEGIGVKFPPG
jgi:hypothetical protein